jgi:ADP-heptose:LPS heptosyltransferase
VIDVAGDASLVDLAALLARCTLYVTGDTGPMHLAAAVGTPVVAVFGPSDPRRYAPLVQHRRVVQIHETLPCAPCNKIRLPPAHCRGVTPACLDNLSPDLVYAAARALFDEVRPSRVAGGRNP